MVDVATGGSATVYVPRRATGSLAFVASDGTACAFWCDDTNQVLPCVTSPYSLWAKVALVFQTGIVCGVRSSVAWQR